MNSLSNDNNKLNSWSVTARCLHWLVAGMIVLQFVLAKLADRADDAGHSLQQLALLAHHKSVGITILALALLRVLWRLRHTPPVLPQSMPRWQVLASQISHWLFYALLFALPISGWLMSSASAYSVSWFNLVQLPDLVAPADTLEHTLEAVHETLAKVLFALALLHIVAAIKHQLIDKDGIMQRMASPAGGVLFISVIAIGVVTLGRAGAPVPEIAQSATSQLQQESTTTPGAVSTARAAEDVVGTSRLPIWNIDYAASYIRFTGDQAGADFTGEWQQWEAILQFARDRLAEARFDVTIETHKVDTRDAERDATLNEAAWFDTANFPRAFYRAGRFTANADGSFVAHGKLIVKGHSFPVDLQFTVATDNGRQTLEGTGIAVILDGNAELDRLQLGVGTGEWADTTWVGRTVWVTVRVAADLPAD